MTEQMELANEIRRLGAKLGFPVSRAAQPVAWGFIPEKVAELEKERNRQLAEAAETYERIGELLKRLEAEPLQIVGGPVE